MLKKTYYNQHLTFGLSHLNVRKNLFKDYLLIHTITTSMSPINENKSHPSDLIHDQIINKFESFLSNFILSSIISHEVSTKLTIFIKFLFIIAFLILHIIFKLHRYSCLIIISNVIASIIINNFITFILSNDVIVSIAVISSHFVIIIISIHQQNLILLNVY